MMSSHVYCDTSVKVIHESITLGSHVVTQFHHKRSPKSPGHLHDKLKGIKGGLMYWTGLFFQHLHGCYSDHRFHISPMHCRSLNAVRARVGHWAVRGGGFRQAIRPTEGLWYHLQGQTGTNHTKYISLYIFYCNNRNYMVFLWGGGP